jgi:hypothetical protein
MMVGRPSKQRVVHIDREVVSFRNRAFEKSLEFQEFCGFFVRGLSEFANQFREIEIGIRCGTPIAKDGNDEPFGDWILTSHV